MKYSLAKAVAATTSGAAAFALGMPAAGAYKSNTNQGCTAEAGYDDGPHLQGGIVTGWGEGWCDAGFAYTNVTLQRRDPGSTRWQPADPETAGWKEHKNVATLCVPGESYRVQTGVYGNVQKYDPNTGTYYYDTVKAVGVDTPVKTFASCK